MYIVSQCLNTARHPLSELLEGQNVTMPVNTPVKLASQMFVSLAISSHFGWYSVHLKPPNAVLSHGIFGLTDMNEL